jgi:hypothetical protein
MERVSPGAMRKIGSDTTSANLVADGEALALTWREGSNWKTKGGHHGLCHRSQWKIA